MIGAFSSEWVKLRRRSMLVWGLGAGLLFSVFATALTIERTQGDWRDPTLESLLKRRLTK